jgi:PEP-CTERM motif-containing protein
LTGLNLQAILEYLPFEVCTLQKCLKALVVIAIFVLPLAAHASPITYILALTQTSGTGGNGTGSFTIDAPPSGIQTTYFASDPTALIALDFDIDGVLFDLTDSNPGTLANTFVQFDGTTLNAIEYAGSQIDTVNKINFTLSMGVSGLQYDFYNQATGVQDIGNITAQIAQTPEPSSLVLMGSGFLGLAGFARRKFAR